MDVRILGLAGRKRSGKNTAAEALRRPPYNAVEVGFADKVKSIARDLYGLDDAQLYGDLKEVRDPRYGLTPRFIMQRLGTEVARSIYADTWVRYLMEVEIPRRVPALGFAVVTDVRFSNEVKAIHDAGGLVFRIERPSLVLDESSNHPSEAEIDRLDVDRVIVNDGTVDDLHDKVRATVDRFPYLFAGSKDSKCEACGGTGVVAIAEGKECPFCLETL